MQSTAATTDVRNPSECDRCRATLERGWSERWSGDSQETMVRVEVVCFNCDRAEYRAEYKQTGVLTSKMTIDAAMYGVRHGEFGKGAADPLLDKVLSEFAEVRKACKAFEQDVWFAGFQSIVCAASHRGFRASFSVNDVPCVALNWTCAGRTVFTLEPVDNSYQVSLITNEDESDPVMGIHGICATKDQAVDLIVSATKALKGGVGFARDDKVGMF